MKANSKVLVTGYGKGKTTQWPMSIAYMGPTKKLFYIPYKSLIHPEAIRVKISKMFGMKHKEAKQSQLYKAITNPELSVMAEVEQIDRKVYRKNNSTPVINWVIMRLKDLQHAKLVEEMENRQYTDRGLYINVGLSTDSKLFPVMTIDILTEEQESLLGIATADTISFESSYSDLLTKDEKTL